MKFLLSLVIVLSSISLQAQFEDLVSWTATFDKESSTIELTADLKEDWVIYSQHTDPEGPIPLEFSFGDLEGVELIGEVEEQTTPIIVMSEMFGVEVIKFKKQAIFTQKVELSAKEGVISGEVTYMTCDSQRCLPPKTVAFEVNF